MPGEFAGKTAGRILHSCGQLDCRVVMYSTGRSGATQCPGCKIEGRMIRGAHSDHNQAIALAQTQRSQQDTETSNIP